MSLKSIDLQFALHKNDEAAMKQNQLSHKPQQDQSILESAASALTESERRRSQKINKSSSTDIQHENNKNNKQEHLRKVGKEKPVQPAASSAGGRADHPFKGHHIDLSL